MTSYERLFAPLQVKELTLANRVVVPPLVQVRPITSAEGIAWCRRLASGGAALVIVEATDVLRFGHDLTPATLRPLAEAIHAAGAAAAIQLFPGPLGRDRRPADLSVAEIETFVEGFGTAAVMCRDAGFDAAEPHGAHSYLLHDFFKPDQNHRSDRYGGSPENRGRLGVEIVRAMRRAAGREFVIGYRHTPTGAEYGTDESLAFVEALIGAGLDVLDVSPAMRDEPADLAAPFAARFDVPVIAVGGMEAPGAAEAALGAGRCDLVAVGRQMIADARWPEKVRDGRDGDVRRCVKCGKCSEMLSNHVPVTCVLWEEDEVAAHLP